MIKKIFIVDDRTTLRNAYKRYIKYRINEYEFKEACNGLEAQRILFEEEYKPDYMILDNKMPILHGINLLQEINEKGLTKFIKIAMCSSDNNNDIILRAEKYGAKFFHKPVNLIDLVKYFQE